MQVPSQSLHQLAWHEVCAGPEEGVSVCVRETRVRDYAAYAGGGIVKREGTWGFFWLLYGMAVTPSLLASI